MKKNTLIFLTLLSLQTFGQDLIYNFNSGVESFEQGGMSGLTATDGALVNSTWSGSFNFVRTPAGLAKTEANYKKIRVVVENSTNITVFQVLNFDSGSTSAGTADKIDVTIDMVTLNSGFTTYDIDVPANSSNSGIIDRLGFRAKGTVTSGTLKIAQIVLIETGNWVANNNFETSTDWTTADADVTAGFTTTDPQEGTQSGTLTFTANQSGNKFLDNTVKDFGETVSPTEINTTFYVKSTIAGAKVQVQYNFQDAGGVFTVSRSSGKYTIVAANTWELVTLNKGSLTDSFNQVIIKIKITDDGVQALNGDVISFDNVQPSIILFSTDNSWTGGKDTEWTDTANWTNGVIPSSLKNSDVQVSSNNPIISATTGATLKNLVVDSGASLTINSGGSLIVYGTSTGNVTYNRNLATTNWYNISSPVVGQGIADFYTNETPDLGSGTGNVQNVAIATYDNSQALAADRYIYYTEGQVDDADGDDTTDTFNTGIGYIVKLQSSQDVSFTGTVSTDNAGVAVTLAQGVTNYNLIGNPYLAFINSTIFLSAESANLESTFWIWNGSSYDTRTTGTHPNYIISPAQAFFVEAKTTNAVTFTEANQSHETDNFQRSANSRPEIKLNLSIGSENRKTELFYIDGTTTGFDNGFDGKMFGGATYDFAIYTDLVSNSVGTKYAVQSLPNSDLENMVIPVGVIAEAGEELIFSIEENNIPSGVKIYLEDRLANTFNELSDNETFKVNLSEALNDIGRFYLHTSTSALSIDDNVVLESVSIYKTDASTLKLVGLPNGIANIKLINVLGKQIMNTSFNANGAEEISLPNLAGGIYIVQLETESGKLNKKIVLE
jgi:hypothetical protein